MATTLTPDQLSRYTSELSDILWEGVDAFVDERGTSFVAETPRHRVLLACGVAAERLYRATGDTCWLEVSEAMLEDVLAVDADGFGCVLFSGVFGRWLADKWGTT